MTARLPIAEHRCPACGLVVTHAEPTEAARAFHCPHCDAHVVERAGHLHLVWDNGTGPVRDEQDEDVAPADD